MLFKIYPRVIHWNTDFKSKGEKGGARGEKRGMGRNG
jgi:hypothetical protein